MRPMYNFRICISFLNKKYQIEFQRNDTYFSTFVCIVLVHLFCVFLFIFFDCVSQSTGAATSISFHTYQNNSKRAAAGLTQRSNSDVTLADDRGAKNKDFWNSNFFAQKFPYPFFTKFQGSNVILLSRFLNLWLMRIARIVDGLAWTILESPIDS